MARKQASAQNGRILVTREPPLTREEEQELANLGDFRREEIVTQEEYRSRTLPQASIHRIEATRACRVAGTAEAQDHAVHRDQINGWSNTNNFVADEVDQVIEASNGGQSHRTRMRGVLQLECDVVVDRYAGGSGDARGQNVPRQVFHPASHAIRSASDANAPAPTDQRAPLPSRNATRSARAGYRNTHPIPRAQASAATRNADLDAFDRDTDTTRRILASIGVSYIPDRPLDPAADRGDDPQDPFSNRKKRRTNVSTPAPPNPSTRASQASRGGRGGSRGRGRGGRGGNSGLTHGQRRPLQHSTTQHQASNPVRASTERRQVIGWLTHELLGNPEPVLPTPLVSPPSPPASVATTTPATVSTWAPEDLLSDPEPVAETVMALTPTAPSPQLSTPALDARPTSTAPATFPSIHGTVGGPTLQIDPAVTSSEAAMRACLPHLFDDDASSIDACTMPVLEPTTVPDPVASATQDLIELHDREELMQTLGECFDQFSLQEGASVSADLAIAERATINARSTVSESCHLEGEPAAQSITSGTDLDSGSVTATPDPAPQEVTYGALLTNAKIRRVFFAGSSALHRAILSDKDSFWEHQDKVRKPV